MPRYLITATGVYMFKLVMNPMMGNTENHAIFGPFHTKEQLKAFYDAEKVEPYSEVGPNTFGPEEKTYRKCFRKGGPLEWMNPLSEGEWDTPGYHGHGVHEVLDGLENVQRTSPAF